MIRVLVADDQALIRGGLRMILADEPDMEVVGEAADGRAAVTMATSTRPDLVLMDIRMPRMDGVEATRLIRSMDPAPQVLVLTTFDLDENVFDTLRAGAAGFLLKDTAPEALVAAIREVVSGLGVLAPRATRRLIEHFAAAPVPGTRDLPGLDDLTEREHEVLLLVARARSNSEIAEELHLGDATVKTHVSHLLAKLGLRDRTQLVVAAYESGLVAPGT